MGESHLSRPFGDGLRPSHVHHDPVVTSIVGLRFLIAPPAIDFGVVAVIVNTVQGGALRALSHVCEKVFKRLPQGIVTNSARYITGFGFTPTLHGLPCYIGGAIFQVVAVGRFRCGDVLPILERTSVASAGGCIPPPEVGGWHFGDFTAGAAALPVPPGRSAHASAGGCVDNGQLSKVLTDEVGTVIRFSSHASIVA